MSGIRQMIQLGTEFWNDSCCPTELKEAVEVGAEGATSNPVIVSQVIKKDTGRWYPEIDELINRFPEDTEVDLAWKIVKEVGKKAARVLEPVYDKKSGASGYLCMQVNPQFYRSSHKMIEHAKDLNGVAKNIAIKAPATETGISAMEEMVAAGISINATVSFSVSQAVACAEAVERGLDRAAKDGKDTSRMKNVVTLMVGRVEDHLKRSYSSDAEKTLFEWAGVAVFKKAHGIFKERNFRSTILAAAYRNSLQWEELIGPQLVQTIPYAWWKKFDQSEVKLKQSIDRPVDKEILGELGQYEEFKKAYDVDGLKPEEFVQYGASVHTLNQFLDGYQKLLAMVRGRMLNLGDFSWEN